MKRIAVIIFLLAVGATSSFGQMITDTISMKKVFGGYQFYKGDKRLTMGQVVREMEPNAQAYSLIKSAQTTNIFATIVGGAGGFMVGFPLGTALGGGEPNWTMAAIGAGLIVVSIPMNQKVMRRSREAVDIYNSGLRTSSFWDTRELKLSMSGYGVGFTLAF
jgi:hypothetical protein